MVDPRNTTNSPQHQVVEIARSMLGVTPQGGSTVAQTVSSGDRTIETRVEVRRPSEALAELTSEAQTALWRGRADLQ